MPDDISKFTYVKSIPIDFGMNCSYSLITKSTLSPFSWLFRVDLNSWELRDEASNEIQYFEVYVSLSLLKYRFIRVEMSNMFEDLHLFKPMVSPSFTDRSASDTPMKAISLRSMHSSSLCPSC